MCLVDKNYKSYNVWTKCVRPTRWTNVSTYGLNVSGQQDQQKLQRTKEMCPANKNNERFNVWTKCVRPTRSTNISTYEVILCSANKINKSFDLWTNCVQIRTVSKYELNLSSQKYQESSDVKTVSDQQSQAVSTYWTILCVPQTSVTDWES